VLPYSADIAAAWGLTKTLYIQWDNYFDLHHDTGHWYCGNDECIETLVMADSAPLAISRAFLKANGIEFVEVAE
jgi:hypothetical protein